jgi:hypothetical protein
MDAAHGISCNVPRNAVTTGAPMQRQGAGGSELALAALAAERRRHIPDPHRSPEPLNVNTVRAIQFE